MHVSLFKAILRLVILCSLSCISVNSMAGLVATELSRTKVSVNETLQVTYAVNNGVIADTPDFSAFKNDFRILNTNYGNEVNMVNGVTTHKTFWQLTLQPKKSGSLTIPAIHFGNDMSAAQQISVDQANVASTGNDSSEPVFIQAEIDKHHPYIQSQVIYKLKVFYRTRLENPRIELPQMKDATFMPLGEDNQYETTINGKPFVVTEKNLAFFPQKTGKLIIPPTTFAAYSEGNGTTLVNNPFFVSEPKTIALATKELALNVQKVPDTFQGANWLPARNITLAEEWSADVTHWETGNPMTRTVTITAEGLRADQIPDLIFAKITGVNTYVDPPKRSNQIKSNTVIGTLVQKITYIPDGTASFAIPNITLNWWNTSSNTPAITQLAQQHIQVKAKLNQDRSIVNSHNLLLKTIQEVAKPQAAVSKEQAKLFYYSIWFWVAGFFCGIWLLTLAFIWRKSKANAGPAKEVIGDELASTLTQLPPNEKKFKQACEQGDMRTAQEFLLIWAKDRYSENITNLEKLCALSIDNDFKLALKNLEHAIYAKHVVYWNGLGLYEKFQQAKKMSNSGYKKSINSTLDPLPPLYPKW